MADTETRLSLSLTVEEGNALLLLMDLAVKAHGLQVAEAAAVLAVHLRKAIEAATPKDIAKGLPQG